MLLTLSGSSLFIFFCLFVSFFFGGGHTKSPVKGLVFSQECRQPHTTEA